MKVVRKVLLACFTIGAVTAYALYPAAVSDGPQDEGGHDVRSYDVFAEEPKTPSDKYDYLIRCWSDFEYPSDRYADFPPFYSGAYMREDQELVILVTSLDQEVIDYFASLIDLEGIHFAQVEHSIDELFAAKEWIDARIASEDLDDSLRGQMRGTGLAFQENKVNVYVGFDLYLDFKVEADIVQTLYTGYDGAQCEVLFKCMELADRRQEEIRAIAPDEDQAHEDMSLEP